MEDTFQLIEAAQKGDSQAKEDLFSQNSGLIWSVVIRFKGRGYDIEDLYQIGAMGFLKAVYKFDTSFGVRFSTYAVPMIIGEIKRFIRDDGIIKVSRSLKEVNMKAKYAQEYFRNRHGREPTINELAEEIGVVPEELVMAMESGREVESVYSQVHQNDGSPIYLIDKLKAEDKSGGLVDLIALRQAIGSLEEREREIIKLRYFQDKTQTQVADIIGISQVQVSRLEKKVLKRIRDGLS